MSKLISISLSPNIEKDDISLTLKSLFKFWDYKKGKSINILEENFKNYLKIKSAFSFNSGRTALMAILKSLNLNSGDGVLIQAFTCNAAINPILWLGLDPIYIDCDEKNFNINIKDLKKIVRQDKDKKIKVLIVQHTFGLPVNLDEILNICKKNNLILIEDCAHSLGAKYKNKKVGTFGKAAFFSFSRDKVISCVYGGMAVTNDINLAKEIKIFQKKIGFPSNFWIFQQLLHPILINKIILPTYQFFGKYILFLFQYLHILSKAVHWKEKIGQKPDYFPKRMPNVLAILALNQFKKLDKFNNHRQKIAKIYYQLFKEKNKNNNKIKDKYFLNLLKRKIFELPVNEKQIFLRFTIKHLRANSIIKKAWKKNILIGDWYDSVIAPRDTNLEKMKYVLGSCPVAEKLITETINLPTHINISEKEAGEIISFLKNIV